MRLIFIQTGGTIDKDYPHTSNGWAFEFGEPATQRILEKLNPSFHFEIVTAFQKDSTEISDNDCQSLVELIDNNNESNFIITHGTDTIIETATYLAKKIENKLIVLTGAMRPERFSNSEAPVNLGAAIAIANVKEQGVYITMHGIAKEYKEMKRNQETGKFY